MNKSKKWKRYEFRWILRNFYFHKVLRQHLFEKYLKKEPVMYYYANKWLHHRDDTNRLIYDLLNSTEPCMIARFGNTELSVMTSVLKNRICGRSDENDSRLDMWFSRLVTLSGFFPEKKILSDKFTDLMLDSCKEIDLHAIWHRPMEDYVVSEYLPQAELTYLTWLEPWYAKRPWTAALKEKKVLVIHPFEKSILKQYEKRKELFPGTEILPEFELKTLKAVQTIAGIKDERFNDWFEALEFMYQEAMKIDFEIAIIGCGAYGMPLAAKLKRAGKKAIHLGGVTQILFGIKGRRWIESPTAKIPFNDSWIFPDEDEIPQNAKQVEMGCYWDFTTKQ